MDVSVEYGDTDLKLLDKPVEVSRYEALADQFDTVHPCLDSVPAMVPRQQLQQGAVLIFCLARPRF